MEVIGPPFQFNPLCEKKEQEVDEKWLSAPISKKKGKGKKVTPAAPSLSSGAHGDVLQNNLMTEKQVNDIKAKLRLLWEFIESAASWRSADSRLFSQWPIINVDDKYHAKSMTTLNKGDFTDQQIEILSRFGCKFAVDADATLTRLALVLSSSKKDVCKALVACKDTLKSPNEDIETLRRCLLEWHRAKEIIIQPTMLRQLPIFKNVAGTYVSPDQIGFILPHEETDEVFTRSKWNDLLEPLFPSHILACASPEDRELLTLALIQPISEQRLVTQFLIKHIDELPDLVCIRILETVYKFQPWRNRDLAVSLLEPLRHLKLVILPSGEKKTCAHFVDPLDPLLAKVMTRHNKTGYFPPPSYQKKEVIKVMQHIGMLSLRNAEGFILVAEIVAESTDLEGGNMLLDTFIKLHNELNFKFSPNEYARISYIAFVPAYDMRECSWPSASVVALPQYSTYTGHSAVSSKKRNKKKSVNANKSKVWEDLDQEALDFEEDGGGGSGGTLTHSELFNVSIEFLSEGGYSKHTYSPKQHMTTFQNCSQQSAAWACWTSSLLLPSSFDKCPPQALRHLSVKHPPDLILVLAHLSNFVSKSKNKTLTEKEISLAQGVIHFCLTEISHTLTYANQSGLIKRVLSKLPFVLLDNGDFVPVSAIVFDLDSDLSDTAMAPPSYLLPFEQLLTIVGAPSFQSEEMASPVIKIRAPNSLLSLANLLHNAFNDPTLSDLKFVVQTRANDINKPSDDVIYAHKLVLAMQNPVFLTMFTSGMAESLSRSTSKSGQGDKSGPIVTGSDNRTTVPMQEWVEYEPLWCFLRYLYTGKMGDEGVTNTEKQPGAMKGMRFHPHTEKSVHIAMGILRLADMYIVDYVKEWCEVYLAHEAVMTLTNVCELLSLAEMSNAKQLQSVCVYNILTMLNVVMQMEQWKELPNHVKNLVLGKR